MVYIRKDIKLKTKAKKPLNSLRNLASDMDGS